MNFALKSKKLIKVVVLLGSALLISLVILWTLWWTLRGTIWITANFQVLDIFYDQVVKAGYAPKSSPQVIYLALTDEDYQEFGKNWLDREYLVRLNQVLTDLGPQAVAYDMLFTHPSEAEADLHFAESIKSLGCVYLPVAFELSEQQRRFQWGTGRAYERLQEFLKSPIEHGRSEALYGGRALMQLDAFSDVAYNFGHINASADPDGVQRHHAMFVNVDSAYPSTLSLSMFLDYTEVSLEDVTVSWGREIRIPAANSWYLEEDVVIPIDTRGRTFIPFPQRWGNDFKNMSVHNLLEQVQNPNLQGNLIDFFEGNFVFIGDLSQGAPDIAPTALEDDVPLIAIHTALLNGLLTNKFYRKWSFGHVILLIVGIGLLLMVSALPKASWIFYTVGVLIFFGLIGFTWFQLIHFTLFPIITVGASFLLIFVGLVIGLQVTFSKQQAFIRNAFARFVPEAVVEEMITSPEKLTLGGEEREITILFSDLQNFTTISERLPPGELVSLLNEYLSEMTQIILEEGGTIDKYLGDAIMAEFGAPLSIAHHADRAVAAALKMQRRLEELRKIWEEKALPQLKCRIGINTGSVTIGNMGSDRVFDYTAIGDAANLASRLEGANKRYQTYLMISEDTYRALTPGRFLTRVLDVITVKGKEEAVKVFEVYGETSDSIDSETLTYYHTYQEAFEAFLARNFTQALEKFALVLQLRPSDPAAKDMISRIVSLNLGELPENWDGSIKLVSK